MDRIFDNIHIGEDSISGLKELISRVGREDMTVVAIGSHFGERAEIMLSTGKVARLYCIDSRTPGCFIADTSSPSSSISPVESVFDERLSKDSRIVKLKKTVQEAIASGDLPEFVDLVYIDARHKHGSIVETIRSTCNICRTLSGSGFDLPSVRDAVTGIYGEPSETFMDESWVVKSPARRCCVVIPVYKSLSQEEEESLDQVVTVLGKNHTIRFVCGSSFDVSLLPSRHISRVGFERFGDENFAGLYQYNQLCCSTEFYERFLDYTHILIYQLDGYAYRDDLLERWMKYDYVGAPWCVTCGMCEHTRSPSDKIGNGGVSLRRVRPCLDLVSRLTPQSQTFPEDLAVFKDADLKKPTCLEACEFSLETMSRRACRHTGRVPSFSHKLSAWDPTAFSAFKKAYLDGTLDAISFARIDESSTEIGPDTVRELFSVHGLDKGGFAHDYSGVYSIQLSRLRGITGRRPRIAVVGAYNGANIAAFSDAVPNAEIYCIDSTYHTDDPRFAVIQDYGYSRTAWNKIPHDIDLIVDDGTHIVDGRRHTVDDSISGIPHFFDHLADDGVLIIEDITDRSGRGPEFLSNQLEDKNGYDGVERISSFLPGSVFAPVPKISSYDDDHVLLYHSSAASKYAPLRLLFITGAGYPDYQNDVLFSGLVESGADITDSSYLWFLSPVTDEQRNSLYGRGFSYSGVLPDRSHVSRDKDEIIQRISDRYYDAVIYGSVWRCRDYLDIVRQSYPKSRIFFVDGEDYTSIFDGVRDLGIYFKRELTVDKSSTLLPISFAIDEQKFNKPDYPKTADLAPQIPGCGYSFTDEDSYYRAYRESRFALTHHKGGFDCMRHYEIVAAGSIPLFTDICFCPKNTMWTWPRSLQQDANRLAFKWLSGQHDDKSYSKLLSAFNEYGRSVLTTRALARYVMSHIG